ncbi:penicillin-binding transpeptidase domain-containing protein [Raoultibacter phocaeensis]|uniref:penicillin-binding transpeptidase domain-containing protein n=1 Tax=Raoultibacter phocaeensis TaxID=2479841 RepID=UPI00111AAC77|nr:penicillin-binding transpeptidase domain-containing protein [Raoultibacter phocaeensis]
MAPRRTAGSRTGQSPTPQARQRPQANSGYVPATPRHQAPKKRRPSRAVPIALAAALMLALAGGALFFFLSRANAPTPPDELLETYFSLVNEEHYDELYPYLDKQAQIKISRDDFVTRHENIYAGIGATGFKATVGETTDLEGPSESALRSAGIEGKVVAYTIDMDTVAGTVSFGGKAVFALDEDAGYFLDWTPDMILPELTWDSKVRVNTIAAERGTILDRNGQLLAGPGTADTAGFVPGAMRKADETAEDSAAYNEDDIARTAELLGTTAETIHDKLSASWVRDDTFVPLKVLSQDEAELIDSLLEIPGIQIGQTNVRAYPLAEKASHLTSYVQNISAEELEAHREEGYTETSVIGKAGLEKAFESELKATDGIEIVIVNENNGTSSTVTKRDKADGKDITLTIDANVQSELYDQFAEDKSCSVAMNPVTGEVLALVSTPTYNANDFVTGMSNEKWTSLNEDAAQPLYNRFQATLCPGSTMKPLTAAIGLDTNAVSATDDLGQSGLSWQKDASWGDYFVTTTMEYSGAANVENALKFSDNIFFAKLALAIGAEPFAQELKDAGFDETIPFEYGLYSSSISDSGGFDSEIQLADSGFGQGQILVNPVHLAAIYASFAGDGTIPQPYLLKDTEPTAWKEGAFSTETARTIRDDLVQVIESGSATEAKVSGRVLGGKTGTAEIKQTVDDTSGTELGWFALFTADANDPNQLLVVSMVEDVKDRGGSHYVVPKVTELFR